MRIQAKRRRELEPSTAYEVTKWLCLSFAASWLLLVAYRSWTAEPEPGWHNNHLHTRHVPAPPGSATVGVAAKPVSEGEDVAKQELDMLNRELALLRKEKEIVEKERKVVEKEHEALLAEKKAKAAAEALLAEAAQKAKATLATAEAEARRSKDAEIDVDASELARSELAETLLGVDALKGILPNPEIPPERKTTTDGSEAKLPDIDEREVDGDELDRSRLFTPPSIRPARGAIKRIWVHGERHSGTGLSQRIFDRANFNLTTQTIGGLPWKHSFLQDADTTVEDEVLYVFVTKSAYAWFASMWKDPYYAVHHRGLPMPKFLRKSPWAMTGFTPDYDYRSPNKANMDGIITLRTQKLSEWYEHCGRMRWRTHVRYEDLLLHPERVLQDMADRFNLGRTSDKWVTEICVVANGMCVSHDQKKAKAKRTYYLDHQYLLKYKEDDMTFVDSKLDHRIERAFGYHTHSEVAMHAKVHSS